MYINITFCRNLTSYNWDLLRQVIFLKYIVKRCRKMLVGGPIPISLSSPTRDDQLINQKFKEKVKNQLDEQKIRMVVERLKRTEERVIAHEMAHKAVGGQYAGAIRYSYARGPDGKLYITGGEVSIDVSEEEIPEETIRKMEIVKRAALAPSDPSPQDYAVAQRATIQEMKARLELLQSTFKQGEEGRVNKKV
jgi:hypothetical protein